MTLVFLFRFRVKTNVLASTAWYKSKSFKNKTKKKKNKQKKQKKKKKQTNKLKTMLKHDTTVFYTMSMLNVIYTYPLIHTKYLPKSHEIFAYGCYDEKATCKTFLKN